MNTPTKPWTTVHLEHKVISESPREVIYRFSDEPERIFTEMELAMRVRSLPQEAPPLSQHDTANEIEDKDRYISSLKRVIWELTENKLKSAAAQKVNAHYSQFTKDVAEALGLPKSVITLPDLANRIENLVRWKKDALKVLGEWDRVLAYLSKSPDVNMGDTLSEKCLEFLQERDALVGWKKEALAELEAWDLVVEYLRKSPDLTIGDTYSEKCLEFLQERDALIRERDKLRVLFEKPVSK